MSLFWLSFSLCLAGKSHKKKPWPGVGGPSLKSLSERFDYRLLLSSTTCDSLLFITLSQVSIETTLIGLAELAPLTPSHTHTHTQAHTLTYPLTHADTLRQKDPAKWIGIIQSPRTIFLPPPPMQPPSLILFPPPDRPN